MPSRSMQGQPLQQRPQVNQFGTTQPAVTEQNRMMCMSQPQSIQDRSSHAFGLDDMQPQRSSTADNTRSLIRCRMQQISDI